MCVLLCITTHKYTYERHPCICPVFSILTTHLQKHFSISLIFYPGTATKLRPINLMQSEVICCQETKLHCSVLTHKESCNLRMYFTSFFFLNAPSTSQSLYLITARCYFYSDLDTYKFKELFLSENRNRKCNVQHPDTWTEMSSWFCPVLIYSCEATHKECENVTWPDFTSKLSFFCPDQLPFWDDIPPQRPQ